MTVMTRVFVVTVMSALAAAVSSSAAPIDKSTDKCTFDSTSSPKDPTAVQAAAQALVNEVGTTDAKTDWQRDLATKLDSLRRLTTKLDGELKTLATPQVNTLKLTKPKRLAIHLANPPPTRLRLSFDSASGRHVEVEWDPTVSSELGRTVTLETETWTIVASVEPSTYTQTAGSVIIHTRFDALVPTGTGTEANTGATLDGMYVALVAALNVSEGTSERVMFQWPRPRLTFACVDLPSMENSQFAPVPAANAGSGLRGFGVAPSVVSDTLSILAEIAVERAKAGAMNLLKKRLIDPFCADVETKVTLAKLDMGFGDELALPRTCELLMSLRVDDILSSGRPLLIALRDDLRHTVAPGAVTRIVGADGLANTVLQSALTLINNAIDRGGIDALDSQLALELLGNVEKLGVVLAPEVLDKLRAFLENNLLNDDLENFKDALKLTCKQECRAQVIAELVKLLRTPLTGMKLETAEKHVVKLLQNTVDASDRASQLVGYACQARLVVAAIKRCQHDGCAAHDVAGMLSRPQDYFADDVKLPLALCWNASGSYRAPPADAAAVQQLVLDGLRLVAPVVDGKGRDRAKAVVRLLVELLRRWEHNDTVAEYGEAFAEIAEALIDEDYSAALNGFVRLAGKLRPGQVPRPIGKIVQLIGAVSSYAAIYKATKDEDPKAAREARKQALESLVDSATDRKGRDDERIFSIGSNVGLSVTWTEGFNVEDGWGKVEPSVRVPLGFSVDFSEGGGLAFRGGVQLADLGQFVRRGSDDKLDDVRWSDFVSPGVEVGFAIPKLDRALNLSLHVAYAPTIAAGTGMTARDGVWRYGVSLGYYVPFFDFN